jgi:hypothetical protein
VRASFFIYSLILPSIPKTISLETMRATCLAIMGALLLESASAYRLFFYLGDMCNGEQLGISRVAGPSTCNTEFSGQAQSVLVKIDNVNDDKYAVKFYDEEGCGGQPLSEVANNQACLVLSYAGLPAYKSYQVTGGIRKRSSSNTNDMVTEIDFGGISNGSFYTPLNHGIGALFENFTHDTDGTITDSDNLINIWWGNETFPEEAVEKRELRGQCTHLVRCTGAFLTNGVNIVTWGATALYNKISPSAGWAPFFKHPLTAAVGGAAAGSGITIIWQAHGAQPAEGACESDGTIRSFVRDMINTFASSGARTGYSEECQGSVCAGVSYAIGNQGNDLRAEGCYAAYKNTDPASSS